MTEEHAKQFEPKVIKEFKEKIEQSEQELLKYIGYDMEIELPYKYLDNFMKIVGNKID